MPPKYGRGGYRRSGYTRTPYAAKKRSSARTGPYSTRRKQGTWGGRKYTRGKAVYGMKSSVPTTTITPKTRVEVKQVNHGQPERLTPFDSVDQVPRICYGVDQAAAVTDINLFQRRIINPVFGLSADMEDSWNATMWVAGGVNAFQAHTIEQNLTSIEEGVEAGKRIGRVVTVTGVSILVSVQNVSCVAYQADAHGTNFTQVPDPKEVDWHLFVVHEKQPGVNAQGVSTHLTTSQFMNTFFDLTNCPNKMTAMIAQKNRYTADAHGKVLMHKKLSIRASSTQVTRRFYIRFPKPLEVRYHGGGSAPSENRLTLYIVPIAPINSFFTNFQAIQGGIFASAFNYVPSACAINSTLYYTDA